MTARIASTAFITVLVFGLSACSVVPREESTRTAPEAERTSVPERPLDEHNVPTAVAQLVHEAEGASRAGEHEQAAAQLERAIRIAPRNAVLWQNLAVVRYRQARYVQAESLALKSNSLTADAALKRRNWSMIAEARRSRGDDPGAREARAHAERLKEQGGWR